MPSGNRSGGGQSVGKTINRRRIERRARRYWIRGLTSKPEDFTECRSCSKPYRKKRHDQLYCGATCRWRAQSGGILNEHTCLHCGEKFKRTGRSHKTRYCSSVCRRRAKYRRDMALLKLKASGAAREGA